MSCRRLIVVSLLMLLVMHVTREPARADGIADGEREFVQELQFREFFDLAEQFCVRQSGNARTPDERAAWQLMLTNCREQHAWTLREPGRTQILTHAAQSITDFVRKESPSAELDLLLRVRQIEVISKIAKIDATCSQFGAGSEPKPIARQAVTEGLQLAESMLEQIDRMRRDIESSVARTARDRTRYVVAELLLFQARQNPVDVSIRSQAAAAAEQLMKSSGDDEMRFQARRLVAESLLDGEDVKGFDHLLISLTSMAETNAQQIAVAALKIHGLLRRDQPSEALQLCLDLEKKNLRSEELSTLRLASLLNLFELLHKLDSPALRQKTADEFRLLNQRVSSSTRGVWRDCCERITLRFSHVEKFGPEAATAVESVADLMAAGEFAAARKSLLDMRPSFERNSPQIAATLSMQAGDLAIRLNDWQAAKGDLASAVELFRIAGNRQQEAASDLLRIYAMGRYWDAQDSSPVEVRNTLEAAYREALEQHIARYTDALTTSKAREWRAMLIRATDPVAAAVELLALSDDATSDQFLLCIQAGDILLNTAFDPRSEATQIDVNSLTAVVSTWTSHAEELLAQDVEPTSPALANEWLRPALKIQTLMFSLRDRWSAKANWKELAADAEISLDALDAIRLPARSDGQPAGLTNEEQTQNTAATANSHAMMALAACRQLQGFDAIQQSRNVLLQQAFEKRRQLASFLLHQASETTNPVPGDPQIGFLAQDLLLEKNSRTMSVDRQLEQLPLLLKASRVADNFQRFDEIIGQLTTKALTDVQLQATASILQLRSAMKTNDDSSSDATKPFWQSVLRRSRSGDEQWLEASLQLATIAVQEKQLHDAAKVLNVIDALHPDWGTPERKIRAAALKAQLKETK